MSSPNRCSRRWTGCRRGLPAYFNLRGYWEFWAENRGNFQVYGGTVPTPRIDKSAGEGIRFNNYNVEVGTARALRR